MKPIALSLFLTFLSVTIEAEPLRKSTPFEICRILQIFIDSPALQEYYHVEEAPDRKPLRLLVNNSRVSCENLTKFGTNVVFIDKPTANLPFLEVLSIQDTEVEPTISFKYGVEGIEGTAVLNRVKEDWTLKNINIIEN